MKKELCKIAGIVAVTLGSLSLYGQGTVNYATANLGSGARVSDAPEFGGAMLTGQNFFAQLWAVAGSSTSSSSLAPVAGALVNFRAGGGAGFIAESGINSLGTPVDSSMPVTVPAQGAGGSVTLQLRVWYGGGALYTSYYDASTYASMGVDPSVGRYGASPLFFLSGTGNPIPPVTTQVDLNGLQGCSLQPSEPSTICILGLGTGALLLFRRRRG